jgi:CDP-diacylglycerol---glycerol-3-phosphate 3-phosphatidyltransferase
LMNTLAGLAGERRNIAIWVTLSRVFLLPLALLPVALNCKEAWLIMAAVIFVSGVTDFGDGFLARKMKLTTMLGAYLDYSIDKIFICGMLIALAVFGVIAVWIPLVVLAREVIISLLRIRGFSSDLLAVDIWGKTKTAVSFLAVGWMAIWESLKSGGILSFYDWHGILTAAASLAPWVMLAAVALTLVSGVNYVWKLVRWRANPQA